MASQRDIRRRIGAVRNIKQITRAMQFVAASKLRRAQESTLANDTSIDVTTEVLTALNQQLPSVSVTPLPQAQQQQQPQGR